MSVSYSALTGLDSQKTQYPFSLGGDLTAVIKRMTLDASYPSGGYGSTLGLSPGAFGLKTIFAIQVLASRASLGRQLNFSWDSVNSKLVVSRNAIGLASMIVEEAVTISSNAGRLANVPAYIVTCHQSVGGTTGAAKVVPVGSTVGTKQVAVNFATGAVATFATDAVTTLLVSYIPMGVGPFVPANQIVDENVTLNSGTPPALANQASLVQYVYNTNGSNAANKAMAIINNGGTAGANQVAIKLDDTGATTTLNTNAAQDTNVAKVTYWKRSALGKAFGFTAQANIATSSNAISFTEVQDIPGILIPCYGTAHVGLTVAPAFVQELAIGPSGSAAANTAVLDPANNKITFAAGDAIVNDELAYIVLNQQQVSPNPGEIPVGTNLSSVVLDVMAIGRPS